MVRYVFVHNHIGYINPIYPLFAARNLRGGDRGINSIFLRVFGNQSPEIWIHYFKQKFRKRPEAPKILVSHIFVGKLCLKLTRIGATDKPTAWGAKLRHSEQIRVVQMVWAPICFVENVNILDQEPIPYRYPSSCCCSCCCSCLWQSSSTRAVLSHGEPRDAAVNFDPNRILQRHRAVSQPQHAFLV